VPVAAEGEEDIITFAFGQGEAGAGVIHRKRIAYVAPRDDARLRQDLARKLGTLFGRLTCLE
jgi:hypothetical protein